MYTGIWDKKNFIDLWSSIDYWQKYWILLDMLQSLLCCSLILGIAIKCKQMEWVERGRKDRVKKKKWQNSERRDEEETDEGTSSFKSYIKKILHNLSNKICEFMLGHVYHQFNAINEIQHWQSWPGIKLSISGTIYKSSSNMNAWIGITLTEDVDKAPSLLVP